MPSVHKAINVRFAALHRTELKEAISEARRTPRTRFVADANVEPWALHVMRYKRFDVIDSDEAGIRSCDDRMVFATAWTLRRLLVTHDADFLDDRQFPFSRCSGLLVLPSYGRVSLEFANLLSGAATLVNKGRDMWFHTKIVATRDFLLKVRTWERSEGRVAASEYRLPNANEWQRSGRRDRA